MPAVASEVSLIPREVLFGNPVVAGVQISPDGNRLSYLAPEDGVLNVWVRTIGSADDHVVTHDRDRGIRSYFWLPGSREIVYLQDQGGNEEWKLFGVDIQTGKMRELTPFAGIQARVVAVDKHFPDKIILSMNKDDRRFHDAYVMDVPTGKLTLVAKNPGQFSEWIVDRQLKVRGAVEHKEDGGFRILARDTEDSPWRTVADFSIEDSGSSEPYFFSKDGRSLYLKDSRGASAARLVALDLSSGRARILAEDPRYDLVSVFVDPDSYEVQMAAFEKARVEWKILDDAIRPDIEAIQKIDSGDFSIQARDDANKKWIVSFVKDNGPAPYYLYERKTRSARFLFHNQPKLKEYTLSRMESFSFVSGDGNVIEGYLTFPAGMARKNLPTVLNVHGGPWSRDGWGYDPETQWIANRGYLSVQVNFRGSSGYGKKFLSLGDKEWGGAMQRDLSEAVEVVASQGFADPKRVAIYGGSYGGYAALAGAAFTPRLYACAVDIVGPSNLLTFIKTIPPYWTIYLNEFYRRVGNPDTEANFLRSRSPLFFVDRIRIPMLIAQGANDPRVNRDESEQMVAALRKKGLKVEYLLFPDEGHGFAKPANRLKFYAAAEKFLAEHLGGRFEPTGDAGPARSTTPA